MSLGVHAVTLSKAADDVSNALQQSRKAIVKGWFQVTKGGSETGGGGLKEREFGSNLKQGGR